MAAPSVATVIIACPQCGTRYQLPRDALGEGRPVQCAKCQHEWIAHIAEPLPDALFDPVAEKQLDDDFSAEEEAAASSAAAAPGYDAAGHARTIEEIRRAIAPRPRAEKAVDPAVEKRRQRAFVRRRATMMRNLPMARLRHTARIVGLVGLVVVLGGSAIWREAIVRQFPDLAGVYAAVGLPVNVVGLDFTDVRTLQMLKDGGEVLVVSGRVVSAANRLIAIPSIVVTLVNDAGAPLYEWSVVPQMREIGPGEFIDFETRLTQPPAGASRVRLSFANARTRAEIPAAPLNDGSTP